MHYMQIEGNGQCSPGRHCCNHCLLLRERDANEWNVVHSAKRRRGKKSCGSFAFKLMSSQLFRKEVYPINWFCWFLRQRVKKDHHHSLISLSRNLSARGLIVEIEELSVSHAIHECHFLSTVMQIIERGFQQEFSPLKVSGLSFSSRGHLCNHKRRREITSSQQTLWIAKQLRDMTSTFERSLFACTCMRPEHARSLTERPKTRLKTSVSLKVKA